MLSNCATIIRPTVIFGEQNRGNVYNLLRQIAGGKFPTGLRISAENVLTCLRSSCTKSLQSIQSV